MSKDRNRDRVRTDSSAGAVVGEVRTQRAYCFITLKRTQFYQVHEGKRQGINQDKKRDLLMIKRSGDSGEAEIKTDIDYYFNALKRTKFY